MEKFSDSISLSKLYKSENMRNTVWDILSEDFDDNFDDLINEAKNIRSLLVKPALKNKCLIKELVIEYGFQFETLEHLKICLDRLKKLDTVDECDGSVQTQDAQTQTNDSNVEEISPSATDDCN